LFRTRTTRRKHTDVPVVPWSTEIVDLLFSLIQGILFMAVALYAATWVFLLLVGGEP